MLLDTVGKGREGSLEVRFGVRCMRKEYVGEDSMRRRAEFAGAKITKNGTFIRNVT